MKINTHSGKWIFKKSLPYILRLIVLVVLVTVISYIAVQFSLVSREVIDTATKQTDGNMWTALAHLAILLLVQLILRIVYIRVYIKTSGAFAMSMRTELFYTLMHKDFSKVSAVHSGEWLNRLISDVSIVAEKVTEIIPNIASLLTTILFSFVALFSLDKQFAVCCLAFGPVVMLAALIYKKKIKTLHFQCRESDGKVRSFLQETMQNFLVIKAFGKEDAMRKNSEALQFDNFRLNVKRSTVGILANVMFFLTMTVAYYAALGWSVYRLSLGLITFGTVTAVLGLVGQLQTPFRELSSVLPQIYMALASAERLMELEQLDDEKQGIPLPDGAAERFACLAFEHVSFSYDGVPVLDDINLTVQKGELVALCGMSGAGKSTLTKLILSVITPTDGNAYIQLSTGEKIEFGAETRRLFSYVPQGNMLLSGTVRDNITFGAAHIDEAKVLNVIELAQLRDLIENLPNGLDTYIGEKGHGLSEGQIQRIAVARALYHDAPVLLLDEATSALDIPTEEKLLNNIRSMTDKTCIIISHRKEVINVCDKTYLLQNGTLQVLQ